MNKIILTVFILSMVSLNSMAKNEDVDSQQANQERSQRAGYEAEIIRLREQMRGEVFGMLINNYLVATMLFPRVSLLEREEGKSDRDDAGC